ncbi:hypothetical protein INT44_004560 [Umbelopsis vinacea]|uniref:Uncharacterized protein n=1 Tax=Umbelopsis vinacea TaxID=44442 RepID=A0A8H7QD06_9FUNG|nr:hypothetical protein INT44_004560 [Umbelopsis vinacea]
MESIGFHHGDSQAPVSDLLMAHGGAGNNLDDWRYEMRREIQEILPNVFLGPYSACRDTQALRAKGITHIVCFFDSKESTIFRTNTLASLFEYTCIEVSDSPLQNLIPQFPTSTKLFNNAINSGGKVLACCNGGMSRSPTFVIAYIMETFRVDFIRAYQFVQGKRLCINPNEGFKSQLKEYEPIYSAWRWRADSTEEDTNRQIARRRPAPDDDEDEDLRRHPRIDSRIPEDHDRASTGISGMIM